MRRRIDFRMRLCESCGNKFEYDEGKVYDDETFVCYECLEESKKGGIE